MKVMITAAELKNVMKTNEVYFTFIKKDGTERKALGTLNMERVAEMTGVPVEETHEKTSSPKVTTYFDCEKKEWRCFSNALNPEVEVW